MKTTATKKVYLTQEEFEIDLKICLEIIKELGTHYICEYTSASLNKSIVHIYIK